MAKGKGHGRTQHLSNDDEALIIEDALDFENKFSSMGRESLKYPYRALIQTFSDRERWK